MTTRRYDAGVVLQSARFGIRSSGRERLVACVEHRVTSFTRACLRDRLPGRLSITTAMGLVRQPQVRASAPGSVQKS